MQPNKKMIIKWKNGKEWEMRIDSAFWYYNENEDHYRLFLDNNGVWFAKRQKNNLDNFSWAKQEGFSLELKEGTLKF